MPFLAMIELHYLILSVRIEGQRLTLLDLTAGRVLATKDQAADLIGLIVVKHQPRIVISAALAKLICSTGYDIRWLPVLSEQR